MTQKWILSITLATFFLSHLPYSYAASWIDTDQWEQEQIDQSKDLKALFEPNPLRNEFDKAEEAYLKDSKENIKSHYLAIVSMAYAYTWNTIERKTLVYCFFRLAQLEPEKEDSYLLRAIELDRDMILNMDEKIFPPPLLQRAKKLRLQSEKDLFYWKPTEVFQDAIYILVNGKIYKYSEHLRVPLYFTKTRIQATFLNHEAYIFIGNALEFLNQEEARIPKKDSVTPKISEKVVPIDLAKMQISTAMPLHQEVDRDLKTSRWEKWKWPLIGAIAVGLLAAAAKSSGSGGSTTASHRSQE